VPEGTERRRQPPGKRRIGGCLQLLVVISFLLPLTAVGGGNDWRAEHWQAAEDARFLTQDLGGRFQVLEQTIGARMLGCKGGVSIWYVAVAIKGLAAAGDDHRETKACLDEARRDLAHGVEEVRGHAPAGHPALAMLSAYQSIVLVVFNDYLPHANPRGREAESDYNQRWERMSAAIEDRATAVRAAIEAGPYR